MRKKLADNTGNTMDVDDDLSSEEELYNGIDSEDIDSDDVNEPEPVFGLGSRDVTEEDFIGLT